VACYLFEILVHYPDVQWFSPGIEIHGTYSDYMTLSTIQKYGTALYYSSILLHRQIEVNPNTVILVRLALLGD